MRKTIRSAFVERMVFLLVKARPQAPVNAALLAAAARFFELLFGHLYSVHDSVCVFCLEGDYTNYSGESSAFSAILCFIRKRTPKQTAAPSIKLNA